MVANERVVSESKGGIEASQLWTFEPEEGGTKVTAAMEYTVPVPLLGKLAERFIVRMNQNEGEVIAANLKARLEG